MDFGEALLHLKEGRKVRRKVWEGYWILERVEMEDKVSGFIIFAFLADGETVAAAQPYQEDLLANDWEVVTEGEH